MIFQGYTKADGTRTHEAPEHWPFGTIGPMTEYAARYALPPDEVLYDKPEKAPRGRKPKVAVAVAATAMPGSIEAVGEVKEVDGNANVFSYMAGVLSGNTK